MLARSERRLRGVVGSLSTARGVIGLGLVEQALLSGAAFLLTAYLARQLSVEAFGAYCVATAIAILLESGLYLMLGDGIPALAARLAPRRWQHLYGAVFVVSVIVSLGFAAVTMAAALYLVATGSAVGAPLAAVALCYPLIRVHGFLRRLCYFFAHRARVTTAAFAYVAVLALAVAALDVAGLLSPMSAFGAQAAASVAASLTIVAPGVAMAWPGRRMLGWCGRRIAREGSWLFGTSLLSWAGNMGLVSLVGFLGNLPAAAGLRVVQTIVSPISQLTTVLISHFLPRTTLRLAKAEPSRHVAIINEVAAVLLCVSLGAALVMTLVAEPFLTLFGDGYAGIGWWVIGLGCVGYALESSRVAYNILIIYQRNARIMVVGQIAACVTAFTLAFALFPAMGVAGLVIASVVGNLANTVFVTWVAIRSVRRQTAAVAPSPD